MEVNAMGDQMTKKERDDAIFWGVIGLIILASAGIWLGKELGWWQFEFPFWPVIAIWIGFAILVSALKKFR